MGGSAGGRSGGSYFNSDPKLADQKLKAAQSKTDDATYTTDCNVALNDLLADYNNRDADAHKTLLADIKEHLGAEIEGSVDVRFAGSVAKHTYVDGLSDVDTLVMLHRSELADLSPQEAKEYLAQRLREELPDADVSVGVLAVTVATDDAIVQLLPALQTKHVVHIADSSGTGWAQIKPREFVKKLTKINEKNGGKVVPAIKLAKAIIASLPEKQRISGYHAEALAVKMFDSYGGLQTPKEMLKFYFETASSLVRSPIGDSTGQSVHVDGYLGKENSVERRIVSDAFLRVSRRMANADAVSSVQQWRDLFEF